MSANLSEVLAAALTLPASARETLAKRLLESLDDEELSPEEIEAEWAAELQRRIEDVESGRVQTVPWPEVEAKLVAMISKHRGR